MHRQIHAIAAAEHMLQQQWNGKRIPSKWITIKNAARIPISTRLVRTHTHTAINAFNAENPFFCWLAGWLAGSLFISISTFFMLLTMLLSLFIHLHFSLTFRSGFRLQC